MFSMADGTQLAYIKETAWGTTPATPAWKVLRLTGESLKVTRESKTSSEITPSRDVTDLIQVAGGASGNINFELSYGAFDDLFSSLFHADWAANVLKNGVKQVPLSIEKKFQIGASDYAYLRYQGMVVNSMNLNISANDIVTGSFGFMGKGGTVDDAIIAGATYVAAATEPVLNASSNVAALSFTGFASPSIMGVSLDIANNLMMANVIGSTDAADIGAGQFSVSGSIEAYFDDAAMYEAFLNETTSALSVTLGAATNKKYKIDLPKIKFADIEIYAGSLNSYVMCSIPFQAVYDGTEKCTMKLTKAVA